MVTMLFLTAVWQQWRWEVAGSVWHLATNSAEEIPQARVQDNSGGHQWQICVLDSLLQVSETSRSTNQWSGVPAGHRGRYPWLAPCHCNTWRIRDLKLFAFGNQTIYYSYLVVQSWRNISATGSSGQICGNDSICVGLCGLPWNVWYLEYMWCK